MLTLKVGFIRLGFFSLSAHPTLVPPSTCRCWRTQRSLRAKATSGQWSWAAFLWSSSRGRTPLFRVKMKPSLPRISPLISCRDTSQNRSLHLPLPSPCPPCAQNPPPRRRRTCSNPSWTPPSPLTLCCTACDQPVPPGTWTRLPGTAGARRSALGLRRLSGLATPPLPAVPRPARPARPPPPHPMRSGKAPPCPGSVFLLMGKLGRTDTRTTERRCKSQPDGRWLHIHGSSLPPTPSMHRQMQLPHPACGSTEGLWCRCMADFPFMATVALL